MTHSNIERKWWYFWLHYDLRTHSVYHPSVRRSAEKLQLAGGSRGIKYQ